MIMVKSAAECQQHCVANSQCQGYSSAIREDGKDRECWLKSKVDDDNLIRHERISGNCKPEARYPAMMKSFGLQLIKPTVQFPPSPLSLLGDDYFTYRSVERNPKAMRFIYTQLKEQGGILTLDS